MHIYAKPPRAQVIALLSACALPFEDLEADPTGHFFGCGPRENPMGVVGIEIYGSVALLRSLAVAEALRGLGLGRRLVAAVEHHAQRNGVEDIYLLTTSARQLFESLGYREVPRESAPPSIVATSEFSSICPASATFMHKVA